LSHDLIAMMSSIFLGAFFLYLLWQSKKRLQLFIKICMSFVLGLGFTAYFWLPAYFEKQYTMVNLLTDELADYHLHFVYLKQFFTSPWGYGGSIFGLNDGLSFQIGQAQLVLGAISLIVSVILIWKKKKEYSIAVLFLLLFIFSLFIQTQHSQFIWDTIQPFSYIQFPWRFLLFSDFTIAFLVAFVFAQIKKQNIKLVLAASMILLLIFMNKDYFRPESYLRNVTDASYTVPSVIKWRTSIMSFEYTPRGIATKKSTVGNTIIAINQNQISSSSFAVIRGKMAVTQIEDIPQQKEFSVSATEPGLLRLNTFTFPGWKTFIDNYEVAYSDDNPYKLITVSVPKGVHIVKAVFTDTPLRFFANIVTFGSLVFVIGYALLKRKYYGKK